jgi:hypothetical protein
MARTRTLLRRRALLEASLPRRIRIDQSPAGRAQRQAIDIPFAVLVCLVAFFGQAVFFLIPTQVPFLMGGGAIGALTMAPFMYVAGAPVALEPTA